MRGTERHTYHALGLQREADKLQIRMVSAGGGRFF